MNYEENLDLDSIVPSHFNQQSSTDIVDSVIQNPNQECGNI